MGQVSGKYSLVPSLYRSPLKRKLTSKGKEDDFLKYQVMWANNWVWMGSGQSQCFKLGMILEFLQVLVWKFIKKI